MTGHALRQRVFVFAFLVLMPQGAQALRVYDNGVYRAVPPAALRRMEHAIIRADQQTWRASPLSAANAATWNLTGGASRWRLVSSSVGRRVLESANGRGEAIYQVVQVDGRSATTRLTLPGHTYEIRLRRPLADAWYVVAVRRTR